MTDGVTKRYELTATRAVILDVLSTNLADPLTGQQARSHYSHWFFESFPETAKLGKQEGTGPRDIGTKPRGWMFPIVEFDWSEFESEVKTLDASKELIRHSLPIMCHSRKKEQANELAEEIKNILSVTNVDDLRTGCLHYLGINGMANDTDFIAGDNKFYTKTIDYRFQRFD